MTTGMYRGAEESGRDHKSETLYKNTMGLAKSRDLHEQDFSTVTYLQDGFASFPFKVNFHVAWPH